MATLNRDSTITGIKTNKYNITFHEIHAYVIAVVNLLPDQCKLFTAKTTSIN